MVDVSSLPCSVRLHRAGRFLSVHRHSVADLNSSLPVLCVSRLNGSIRCPCSSKLCTAYPFHCVALRCISLPLHFTARRLQSLPSHLAAIAFHSMAAHRHSLAEHRCSIPLRCGVTFLPSGTGLAHCFATGQYRKIFRNPAIPSRPFRGRRTDKQQ